MNPVILSGGESGLSTVINAVGDVFSFAATCLDEIVKSPILLFFFAAGLIPLGLHLVRRLKRTASAS